MPASPTHPCSLPPATAAATAAATACPAYSGIQTPLNDPRCPLPLPPDLLLASPHAHARLQVRVGAYATEGGAFAARSVIATAIHKGYVFDPEQTPFDPTNDIALMLLDKEVKQPPVKLAKSEWGQSWWCSSSAGYW